MNAKSKWILTIVSAGILSYIIADIIHEVMGHAGTCLGLGHRITLLSSVYFKSNPGSFITDIGGPLANLFFGLLAYFILKKIKGFTIITAFFLLTLMSYNLFWFCGTIVESGFSNDGDWGYLMEQFKIASFTEPVLLFLGIIAFLISVKLVTGRLYNIHAIFPDFPLKPAACYAYTGAIAAAAIAGLFFPTDKMHTAVQGALEMVSSLPVLFINNYDKIKSDFPQPAPTLILAIIALIIFISFCLILGNGITLS
ncbi:MAG TPA: hypothetical protein VG847_05885 [Chitinophagaceae bacterium]|nr:hypothetical protein [Chitinophagaceae bacterium]